ncbi:CYTH domain-containing protein [Verrucomicrobium sp. BvORR106]|uniref:CYTH domain-containing protein n=1 Tax=Verrucomicrobium sp. BvORR106 TaxID=1403819 RepID=UPI00068EE228|nr:CYTH domain-containing protein [Verrucomicrobium sp. BvORR106]
MGVEIERKFLICSNLWRSGPPGVAYRQGYLCRDKERTVRVRLAGSQAYVTIKGARSGLSRAEFEYAIPPADAELMLQMCLPPLIEKTRYLRAHGGFVWEIDEFHGENAGLVVAEIELPSEETPFDKPSWAGTEVSHDPRYFNSRLAEHPYSEWGGSRARDLEFDVRSNPELPP